MTAEIVVTGYIEFIAYPVDIHHHGGGGQLGNLAAEIFNHCKSFKIRHKVTLFTPFYQTTVKIDTDR